MNPIVRDHKAIYNHSFAHNFTAVHPVTLQTTLFGLTLVITRHPRRCRPPAGNIVGALYHKL